MDEVGITLPPHWEYRYYEKESKGNDEWNFYVDGDRMQWSKITRPLPSDPKPQE